MSSFAATPPPMIALGAMTMGTVLDQPTSFALLDAYVNSGGVWIDTADCYAFWLDGSGRGGASETMIGRWLRANPGVRDQIKISTKVGAEPVEPGGKPQGLAPATIKTGLLGSLDRLGVDRIDLFWGHLEDRSVPVEESALALAALVTDGAVDRIGLSNHAAWRAERALAAAKAVGAPTISAIQLRETYLHSRPDARVPSEDHAFGALSPDQRDHAAANDLEIWAYTPMLGGFYDRSDRPYPEPYAHPGTDRRLDALTAVAGELGVQRGQVVMAWLAGGQPAIRPILGGSKLDQLAAGLAGVRLVLTPEQRALLDSAV